MAVILAITYQKKLGLPNFSSHSCSVSLTVEIPDVSAAAQESSRLYELLQAAVDAEACGTYRGWMIHRTRRTTACVRCRTALTAYQRTRREKAMADREVRSVRLTGYRGLAHPGGGTGVLLALAVVPLSPGPDPLANLPLTLSLTPETLAALLAAVQKETDSA